MFLFLSKVLDVFLSPYTWGLALLAAALPWRQGSLTGWKRRRALGILGLLVLLVSSNEPVANALQWRLEHAAPSTYRSDVTYDAVILLGGVVDERVTASTGQTTYNDAIERLIVTHELLKADKARFAIVSGAAIGPEYEHLGEGRMLAKQLALWGMDTSRVIVEDKARNTRENAVYAAEVVRARGFARVLIVTSAYHMPRSIECFNAVGLKVDALAVDYHAHDRGAFFAGMLPRPYALATTTLALREMVGRWVYRWRGYGKA